MYTIAVFAPNRDSFERYVRYIAKKSVLKISPITGVAVVGSSRYVVVSRPTQARGLSPSRIVMLRDWQHGSLEDDIEDLEIQIQLWSARNKIVVEYPPFF